MLNSQNTSENNLSKVDNENNGVAVLSCPADIHKQYRYTRNEMLALRDAPASNKRPVYLSTDFDNDQGKFMPEKWVEYRWICEGIENRPNAASKRKEKLKAEALENESTVLSPQRRGFSSGCRAASPTKKDGETQKNTASKGTWRSNQVFYSKNSSASEFKPSFQKNAQGEQLSFVRSRFAKDSVHTSDGHWRNVSDVSFNPNFHKDSSVQRNKQNAAAGENIPEWLDDGAESIHDVVELKGFEDDANKKKKDGDVPELQMCLNSQVSIASDFSKEKITSNDTCSQKNDSLLSKSENNVAPSVSHISKHLPDSDVEFAAVMGILEENDLNLINSKKNSIIPNEEPRAQSLFCRFFSSNENFNPLSNSYDVTAGTSDVGAETALHQKNHSIDARPGTSDYASEKNVLANPILQRLFDSSANEERYQHVQNLPNIASLRGPVHVEDLERGFQIEAELLNSPGLSNEINQLRALRLNSQSATQNVNPSIHSQIAGSKGNPLGDPYQQAHLLNRLSQLSQQQRSTAENFNSHFGVPMSTSNSCISNASQIDRGLHMHHIGEPSPVSMRHEFPFSQVHHRSAIIDDQQARNLHMNQNFQSFDGISSYASPSVIVHQQQGMKKMMRVLPNTNSSATPMSNSFMPTSVIRHLTKQNAEEKATNHFESKIAQKTDVVDSVNAAANFDSNTLLMLQNQQLQQHQLMQHLSMLQPRQQQSLQVQQMQQYAQFVASIRANASSGFCRPPVLPGANLGPQFPAMLQAEQQRQIAQTFLRDARACALSIQNSDQGVDHIQGSQQDVFMSNTVANQPCVPITASSFGPQNPIEKLLQPASSLIANQSSRVPISGRSGLPSIVDRLPPSANCISVEELERQFAQN